MFAVSYICILFVFITYLVCQLFKYKSTPEDRVRKLIEKRVQRDFQIRAHNILVKKPMINKMVNNDHRYNALLDWKKEVEDYYRDYEAQVELEVSQYNVIKLKI
ncbi:hypothetical protein CBQ28_16985 [Pseudoalteromonas sp. GCY]|nr:hypothetical protein CBQ28_16985 [Pseudoalteromonas sp. GCY]